MGKYKNHRFLLTADPEWLAAVDDWRREQTPIPPRTEAVRTLVTEALAVATAPGPRPTQSFGRRSDSDYQGV